MFEQPEWEDNIGSTIDGSLGPSTLLAALFGAEITLEISSNIPKTVILWIFINVNQIHLDKRLQMCKCKLVFTDLAARIMLLYCAVNSDALRPLLNCIIKPIKIQKESSIPAHFPYCKSSTLRFRSYWFSSSLSQHMSTSMLRIHLQENKTSSRLR